MTSKPPPDPRLLAFWGEKPTYAPEPPRIEPEPNEYYRRYMTDVLAIAQRYGKGQDWMAAQLKAPSEAAMKSLGYVPGYWEDPRRVAKTYLALQALPKGEKAPEWLNVDQLTAAYKYLQYRNGGQPWSEWKFLNAADPGRDFLQQMGSPPSEFLNPSEQQVGGYAPGVAKNLYGFTETDWNALEPWKKWVIRFEASPASSVAMPTAMGGAIGLAYGGPAGALAGAGFGLATGAGQAIRQAIPGPVGGLAGGALMGGTLAGGFGMMFGPEIGLPAGILGAVVGATLGVAKPDALDAALLKLNALAEGVEQAWGTASIAAYGVGHPQEAAQADLPAMWRAAKLTYDVGEGPFGLVGAPKTTTYLEPGKAAPGRQEIEGAAGMAALVEAANRIQRREDPETVYRDIQSRMGLDGQARNLLGQVVFDPLNVLPQATNRVGEDLSLASGNYALADAFKATRGPGEAIQAYRAFVRTGMAGTAPELSSMSATERWFAGLTSEGLPKEVSGMLIPLTESAGGEVPLSAGERAIEIAGRATTAASGGQPIETPLGRSLGALKLDWLDIEKYNAGDPEYLARRRAQEVEVGQKAHALTARANEEDLILAMGVDNARLIEQGKKPTPLLPNGANDYAAQEWLARFGERTTRTQPVTQENLPKGIGEPWFARIPGLRYLFSETPQAKASEVMRFASDNIQTLMGRFTDPVEAGKAFNSWVDTPVETAAQLSSTFLAGPEGYFVALAGRGAKDMMAAKVELWEATLPQRTMLSNMAVALGTTPEEVIKALRSADDMEVLVQRVLDAAKTTRTAEGDTLIEAARRGEFSGQALADAERIYVKESVPWRPDLWISDAISGLVDHYAHWSVDHFGIKAEPTVLRMAQTMKGIQSLVLLGLNPVYFFNNWVNNEVSMAARGVWGLWMPEQIDAYWRRVGVDPYRLRAGIGPADMPGDITVAGERTLRAATQVDDVWSKLNNKVAGLSDKVGIFLGMARSMEQWNGARAFTSGFKQMWARLWHKGTGYSAMPPDLESALGGINPNLPPLIYGAIESGLNGKEILGNILGQAVVKTAESAVPEVASRLGIAETELRDLLGTMNVADFLNARLPKANTPDKVAGVFADLRRNVMGQLEKQQTEEWRQVAEYAAERVKAEGYGAVADLFFGSMTDAEEWWNSHFAKWQRTFEEARQRTDSGPLIEARSAEANSEARRMWAYQEATLQGISDGLTAKGVRVPDGMVDSFAGVRKTWDGFFKYRSEEYRKFFRSPEFEDPVRRGQSWIDLNERMDVEYAKANGQARAAQEAFDEALVRLFRSEGDPATAARVKTWRDGLRSFRDDMAMMMANFRKTLVHMDAPTRDAAWRNFLDKQYLPSIAEFFERQRAGPTSIWGWPGLGGPGQLPLAGPPEVPGAGGPRPAGAGLPPSRPPSPAPGGVAARAAPGVGAAAPELQLGPEWVEVPQGARIPLGSETKFNFETNKIMARVPPARAEVVAAMAAAGLETRTSLLARLPEINQFRPANTPLIDQFAFDNPTPQRTAVLKSALDAWSQAKAADEAAVAGRKVISTQLEQAGALEQKGQEVGPVAPKPEGGPATMDQLDTDGLRQAGWTRGRRGLLNAVNADRIRQGLPAYPTEADVPFTEAVQALTTRVGADELLRGKGAVDRMRATLQVGKDVNGVDLTPAARTAIEAQLAGVERRVAQLSGKPSTPAPIDLARVQAYAKANSLGTSEADILAAVNRHRGEGAPVATSLAMVPEDEAIRAIGLDADARWADGVSKALGIEAGDVVTARQAARQDLTKLGRDRIDAQASQAFAEAAAAMRARLEAVARGEFQGLSGINMYPDWMSALHRPFDDVMKAVNKIIEDAGRDKGALVEKLKATILDAAMGRGPASGELPLDPRLLLALGMEDEAVMAAVRGGWAPDQAFGTRVAEFDARLKAAAGVAPLKTVEVPDSSVLAQVGKIEDLLTARLPGGEPHDRKWVEAAQSGVQILYSQLKAGGDPAVRQALERLRIKLEGLAFGRSMDQRIIAGAQTTLPYMPDLNAGGIGQLEPVVVEGRQFHVQQWLDKIEYGFDPAYDGAAKVRLSAGDRQTWVSGATYSNLRRTYPDSQLGIDLDGRLTVWKGQKLIGVIQQGVDPLPDAMLRGIPFKDPGIPERIGALVRIQSTKQVGTIVSQTMGTDGTPLYRVQTAAGEVDTRPLDDLWTLDDYRYPGVEVQPEAAKAWAEWYRTLDQNARVGVELTPGDVQEGQFLSEWRSWPFRMPLAEVRLANGETTFVKAHALRALPGDVAEQVRPAVEQLRAQAEADATMGSGTLTKTEIAGQGTMWTQGEDLPLWSGAAQRVTQDPFMPEDVFAQDALPGMRPPIEAMQPIKVKGEPPALVGFDEALTTRLDGMSLEELTALKAQVEGDPTKGDLLSRLTGRIRATEFAQQLDASNRVVVRQLDVEHLRTRLTEINDHIDTATRMAKSAEAADAELAANMTKVIKRLEADAEPVRKGLLDAEAALEQAKAETRYIPDGLPPDREAILRRAMPGLQSEVKPRPIGEGEGAYRAILEPADVDFRATKVISQARGPVNLLRITSETGAVSWALSGSAAELERLSTSGLAYRIMPVRARVQVDGLMAPIDVLTFSNRQAVDLALQSVKTASIRIGMRGTVQQVNGGIVAGTVVGWDPMGEMVVLRGTDGAEVSGQAWSFKPSEAEVPGVGIGKIKPTEPLFSWRKDATPEVRDLAKSALMDAVFKGQASDVLGKAIAEELQNTGVGRLIGKRIATPRDVAYLGQIYRDPRFETFRWLFVKNGRVVAESAYSSRLPGVTYPFETSGVPAKDLWESELFEWASSTMDAYDADGYYLLHNHPSGDPGPSPEDIATTGWIAKSLPGFKGHLVVDSGKYAVIRPETVSPGAFADVSVAGGSARGYTKSVAIEMEVMPESMAVGWVDELLQPSKPHAILGERIVGPADVIKLAKGLMAERPESKAMLIFASARLNVRGIVDIPMPEGIGPWRQTGGVEPRANLLLRAFIRYNGRKMGSSNAFLVVPDMAAMPDATIEALRDFVLSGSFKDVVDLAGKSVQSMVQTNTSGFWNAPKGPEYSFGWPERSRHLYEDSLAVRPVEPKDFGGFKVDREAGRYGQMEAYLPEGVKSDWFNTAKGPARVLGLAMDNPNEWLFEFGDGVVRRIPVTGEATDSLKASGIAPFGSTPQPMLMGKAAEEFWNSRIDPTLTALQEVLSRPERVGGAAGVGDLPPASRQALEGWLNGVQGEMGTTKMAAIRWGENRRDAALLNYSRRYGFDNVGGALLPYMFWYSRTPLQWAFSMLDKPAIFANYARIRQLQGSMPIQGFPTRLRDKVQIPMPFLPEWMGDGIWVDPMRQLFPPEQFFQVQDQMIQDQTTIERSAMFILTSWVQDGKATREDAAAAVQTKTGDLWQRAVGQAKLDLQNEVGDPFDYMSMLVSPALPVTWAYDFLTGQKGDISPLPLTRLIQAATAFWKPGGVNIEAPVRKMLGMPEGDKWFVYRVDREITNMAGDGEITVDDAENAMTAHAGPVYEEAKARAVKLMAVGTYTAWIGLPGDTLPTGEAKQRALANEYKLAGAAYDSGQTDAIGKFFDAHPEYTARLGLMDKPADRLRRFLVDKVWAGYNALDRANREVARDALGDNFQLAFLNKETRAYDAIDTETLAVWAKMLGKTIPSMQEVGQAGEVPSLAQQGELLPESISKAITDYRNARDAKYPNWYAIQAGYYEKETAAEKRAYRLQFPELEAYWAWSRQYKVDHPDVAPYISAAKFSQQDYMSIGQAVLAELTPSMQRRIYSAVTSNSPLPAGTSAYLQQILDAKQVAGGNVEAFMQSYVSPLFEQALTGGY